MAPGGYTAHSQAYINTHGMAVESYPVQVERLQKLLDDKEREIRELRSEVFRLRNEARRKR